jgi:hypothetical protein
MIPSGTFGPSTVVWRRVADRRVGRSTAASVEGRYDDGVLDHGFDRGVSPSTATRHMQELENTGLVEISRQGRFSYIALRRERLAAYLEHMVRM